MGGPDVLLLYLCMRAHGAAEVVFMCVQTRTQTYARTHAHIQFS